MLSKLTPVLTGITSRVNALTSPEPFSGELRTLVILTVFGVLFALEARCAFRQHAASAVRQSYFTNLGSFILNDMLMSLLSISSLWFVAERYSDTGLFSGVANRTARTIGSFLLLDLTLYFWHRANHNHDALWMFHKVHHSDRCMNVSTAFRLHGAEIVLTTLVKAAFIALIGMDTGVLLANEAVVTLFVMFHHANIAFRGEHWLGRFIVVPSLHRVHHSTKRSEHDHNYAAVFSFWDRLFGTFEALEPRELGLQNVPGQSLIELLKFGLARPSSSHPETVLAMIAEAAYYRSEKRGFTPGYDFVDWLEAEKEVMKTASMSVKRDSCFWPGIARCFARRCPAPHNDVSFLESAFRNSRPIDVCSSTRILGFARHFRRVIALRGWRGPCEIAADGL